MSRDIVDRCVGSSLIVREPDRFTGEALLFAWASSVACWRRGRLGSATGDEPEADLGRHLEFSTGERSSAGDPVPGPVIVGSFLLEQDQDALGAVRGPCGDECAVLKIALRLDDRRLSGQSRGRVAKFGLHSMLLTSNPSHSSARTTAGTTQSGASGVLNQHSGHGWVERSKSVPPISGRIVVGRIHPVVARPPPRIVICADLAGVSETICKREDAWSDPSQVRGRCLEAHKHSRQHVSSNPDRRPSPQTTSRGLLRGGFWGPRSTVQSQSLRLKVTYSAVHPATMMTVEVHRPPVVLKPG